MEEDNRREIMIRASNNAGLTKEIITDTWHMKGLMGVYNLGLEHMLSYLEKNDKTKALTPTLWGDGYSDGELKALDGDSYSLDDLYVEWEEYIEDECICLTVWEYGYLSDKWKVD